MSGRVWAVLFFVIASCAQTRAAPAGCATCHPVEAARFDHSPMGTSIAVPALLPDGTVTQSASQSTISITQRNGQMIHRLSERSLTAEYPIRYQIGGGLMGRTYMVQTGDYLFESPVSWFNAYGWDISPGYKSATLIDFDRPMEQQCLFCHAGNPRFADTDERKLQSNALTPITCDRCHGPTAAHLRQPSASNIVNPAKLTGAARDSVCEQCHLEGATRVLNPGKSWTDFHAGERTETIFATYLLGGGNNAETIAVSQVEQLAHSKCARESGGKLWCGTCHDPHGARTVNREQQLRAICTGCHKTLSAAAHPPGGEIECTRCHMPRRATTDISHAALTDHRILRRPSEVNQTEAGQLLKVKAWRPPSTDIRDRDYALAEVLIGFAKQKPSLAMDGFARLEKLPTVVQQNDPVVLSDLEGFSLQQQKLQEALQFGRRVIELQPQSAKAALNLGIVLKRAGQNAEAEKQLGHAIELDPSLKQAYIELATLYASEGNNSGAIDTINRFLKWNPQDILFRIQLQRLTGGNPRAQ